MFLLAFMGPCPFPWCGAIQNDGCLYQLDGDGLLFLCNTMPRSTGEGSGCSLYHTIANGELVSHHNIK